MSFESFRGGRGRGRGRAGRGRGRGRAGRGRGRGPGRFSAPKEESPVHDLARTGDTAGLQKLLVTDPEAVDRKDHLRRTPLHVAAWAGHAEFVEALLSFGADGRALAADRFTALHFACMKGHAHVAEVLLTHGASEDVNCTDVKKGRTPLHLAVAVASKPKSANGTDDGADDHPGLQLVQLLLKNGANSHVKNKTGQTPIFIAKDDAVIAALKEAMGSQQPLPVLDGNEKQNKKKNSRKRKVLSEEEKDRRSCPECGRQFSSRGMLLGHLDKVHGITTKSSQGLSEAPPPDGANGVAMPHPAGGVNIGGVTMPPAGHNIGGVTMPPAGHNIGGVTMPPAGHNIGGVTMPPAGHNIGGVTMPPAGHSADQNLPGVGETMPPAAAAAAAAATKGDAAAVGVALAPSGEKVGGDSMPLTKIDAPGHDDDDDEMEKSSASSTRAAAFDTASVAPAGSTSEATASTTFLATPQDGVEGSGGVGGWKKPPQVGSGDIDHTITASTDAPTSLASKSKASTDTNSATADVASAADEEPPAKRMKHKKKKKSKNKKARTSLLSFM